jgi:hypothetical protein
MTELTETRIALNEALFRKTNEAIRRGQWPNEPGKLIRFRCECSVLDCGEAVEATIAEYERVRSEPRWFLILEDHLTPQAEEIVWRTDNFVVVEKTGVAGEVAEMTDPRTEAA